jgi:hypothetical protein
VEDKDTEYQYLVAPVVLSVHVTPKSVEVHILPVKTAAVWYCPVEDKDTEYQLLDAPVALSVQFTP